jgi:hypothetical protein
MALQQSARSFSYKDIRQDILEPGLNLGTCQVIDCFRSPYDILFDPTD